VKNQNLSRALAGKLWSVHRQSFNEMLALLQLTEGVARENFFASLRAEQDLRAANARSITSNSGTIAVIPIYGILAQRGSFWSMFFGGASCEGITAQLRQAVNDPTVKAIVLDVDSPGGDVAGITELAGEIFQARKAKTITAVANSMCASGAYWLASQATELLVSPSSNTGSIGVYMMHEEYSKALENAGIKDTIIKFGENKAEGNDSEPLTAEALEHFQSLVDSTGQDFEKAVARGRKVTQDEVHKKFGQGRTFDARTAVKLGMADRVGTFDDALAKHGAARAPLTRASGEAGTISALNAAAVDLEAKAAKADDNQEDDPDGDDCACACSECKAGDCKACSHVACACDGCTCDAAAKARKVKQSSLRRRLELAAA
jgi:signal peptide peptidase SppA